MASIMLIIRVLGQCKNLIKNFFLHVTRCRLLHIIPIIAILILSIPSQFLFSNAQYSNPRYKIKPDVTIIGPICMADGIGRQTIELVRSIDDDVTIQIKPTSIIYEDLPKEIEVLISQKYYRSLGDIVLFEDSIWTLLACVHQYLSPIKNSNQVRIAYSMVEFSRIPREWAELLNMYFDAIVVPDPFLVEVYKESGVSIPIFVLPLQLDFQPLLNLPLKQKSHSPMVFANLGAAADRKNQLLLVRAFAKALGNCDNAVLRINSRMDFNNTSQKIKNEIRKLGCSNIHFTSGILGKKEYLELFRSVDCFVSLSKGEGFSIQPREAMALGIPVIVTNNTAQSTICKSGLVKVVESEILESINHILLDMKHPLRDDQFRGYQFDCDVDEAAEAIKDVYLNYEKYLGKAEAAREWASQYDLTNVELKEKYNSLINPKNVILGSENVITPEFIITDSIELYEKYKNVINAKDYK